jgi:ABC-type nitrate/sulfonate/bicarbonate transport system permease component
MQFIIDILKRSWLIAVLFLGWQMAIIWGTPGKMTPTPVGALNGLIELGQSGALLKALVISLNRVFWGFSIAFVMGVSLGILMGGLRTIERWLDPLIESLRPIPPIAWVPLAIIWFGLGDTAPIFIVTIAAFFYILINTIAATKNVDRLLIEAAHTLGASRWMIVWEVILPSALPVILVGARLGMGAAWMSIIAAELTAGSRVWAGQIEAGIGELMYRFFAYEPNLNYVVTCMAIIGFVALVIDSGFRLLHRSLSRRRK